nr:lipolytic protein [uncultured bacterium]
MASVEMESIVEALRARGGPAGGAASVAEQRALFEAAAAALPPVEGVQVEPVTVAGRPAEWVARPGAPAEPALLYLHGGAYVLGSPATHRRLTSALALATGARVLALDYRLAPEHPYPAAVDDAVAAWRWLVEREGLAPEQLGIAGDSAGGGLAVATMVAARDAGLPLPAAAALLSPWVDLEGRGESVRTRAAADPMLDAGRMPAITAMYLAGQDPRAPLASPIHADLRGLPPLLIHAGDREILLDDAVRLAERARDAGVDVTCEVWPEMIHVWHFFTGLAPEATEGVARVAAFLRDHLGAPGPAA